MNPQVYLAAAKLIEDNIELFSCIAIKRLGNNGDVFNYAELFSPDGNHYETNAWFSSDEMSFEQDKHIRIIGLCFMAAIASDSAA